MTFHDRTLHFAAAPAGSRPAPHIPPRRSKAHRIGSDAESIGNYMLNGVLPLRHGAL